MAVKTTLKIEDYQTMRSRFKSKQFKTQLGNLVVSEIKENIAKGISPVFKERRFEKYKDPSKYPGNRKKRRPVNMYLSGDMLEALKFRLGRGFSITFGWFGGGLQTKKANNHNSGDTVPKRRLIPDEKNERFNASITRVINDYYGRVLSDILKRRR